MKRISLALAFGASLWSSSSFGFCRATTCDVSDALQHCVVDARTQCVKTGTPLRWVSGCITVNVQADGAPTARISAEATEASVRRAFDAWLSADCGGGSPSIAVEIGSPVSCGTSEYSTDHHNANIVMYRENEWPYEGGEDALGITRLRFDDDQAPGELWDADIELNAVAEPLAVGTPDVNQVDLDSLITHEVGHLLGLGHTLVSDGTMSAGYVKGSTELRSLADDDVAGICAIYPPGRDLAATSCAPRHGFSDLCAADQPTFAEPPQKDDVETSGAPTGCGVSRQQRQSFGSEWLILCGFVLLLQKRRR